MNSKLYSYFAKKLLQTIFLRTLTLTVVLGAAFHVSATICMAQESYPLTCRGIKGAEIGFETGRRMSFRYKKGTAPAGAGLAPGECSWSDRGMREGEPDILFHQVKDGADLSNTEYQWTKELDDPDNYWVFDIYKNAEGQFVAKSAKRALHVERPSGEILIPQNPRPTVSPRPDEAQTPGPKPFEVDRANNTINDRAAELQRQELQTPEVTVDPSTIRVNRREPKPFVAFEMRDPKTGAEIGPETVLTLPDGKKVAAGQYYDELNKVEQGLNELGYSLREDWDSIVIQETINDTTELSNQAKEIAAAHDQTKPLILNSFEDLKMKMAVSAAVPASLETVTAPGGIEVPGAEGAGRSDAGRIIKSPQLPRHELFERDPKAPKSDVTTHTVKEWPLNIGNPKTFAAYVNGKLELSGTRDNLSIAADASGGCYIFTAKAEIIRLTSNMNAPAKGDMSGKINLYLAPKKGAIYSFLIEPTTSVLKDEDVRYSVDLPIVNTVIPIGWVPVRLKAGAAGDAGLYFMAGLNPRVARANLRPYVHTSAYLQAGVDYIVAGAGAAVELTLLNYDLNMDGTLELQFHAFAKGTALAIHEAYVVHQQLNMLNGRAYAYAFIYVPRFRLPPWKKKQWNWTIFDWKGFKPVDGDLFNGDKWTSLSKTIK